MGGVRSEYHILALKARTILSRKMKGPACQEWGSQGLMIGPALGALWLVQAADEPTACCSLHAVRLGPCSGASRSLNPCLLKRAELL